MREVRAIRPGLEADVPGKALPPTMQRWLDQLPGDLIKILNRFADHGHGVWLVGGAVRDAMLERSAAVGDIDLATTCHPEATLALFGSEAIDTGSAFGTVTLKGDGALYEVTTLRTESVYRDGRRPERVAWGDSLQEDLSRRDFTVNAMAVDAARAALYDPFNGASDMNLRCIRAVGEAMVRCEEDALRILRAYRFLRMDDGPLWSMDARLQLAVRAHRDRLRMVSVERHWMELKKMLGRHGSGALLRMMQADGVLATVMNPALPMADEILTAMDRDDLAALSAAQRLAMATVRHPTRDLMQAMKHLRISREFQREAATFHEQLQHLPSSKPADLRVFAHVLGKQAHQHLKVRQSLHDAGVNVGPPPQDTLERVMEAWEALPALRSPGTCLIDGHWLMQRTGLQQGMRLGRLKDWLWRLQIERDIDEKAAMEHLLSRLPYEHGDHQNWPQVRFP